MPSQAKVSEGLYLQEDGSGKQQQISLSMVQNADPGGPDGKIEASRETEDKNTSEKKKGRNHLAYAPNAGLWPVRKEN